MSKYFEHLFCIKEIFCIACHAVKLTYQYISFESAIENRFIVQIFLTFIQLVFFLLFNLQSLVLPEKFQHILRIMGTNIDGKRKVMFAMTAIKGVGRRYANIVLKKADVNLDKRAGECSEEEVVIFRFIFEINL